MFHKVRILDREGNTKKVLSSKVLSKTYWNSILENSSKTEVSMKSKFKENKKTGQEK